MWGGKGLWELPLLQKGPVQGGRRHAMAPGSLRPTLARKKRGRWGEPGSFTLPGPSLGWGLCQGSRGSEFHGQHGDSGAGLGQAAWDPPASKTHWGRAGVAFVSKARGQQASVTCVPSAPTVVSQRGEANTPAECQGMELGNLPEAISS